MEDKKLKKGFKLGPTKINGISFTLKDGIKKILCILLQPVSIELKNKNIYEAIYKSHYDD